MSAIRLGGARVEIPTVLASIHIVQQGLGQDLEELSARIGSWKTLEHSIFSTGTIFVFVFVWLLTACRNCTKSYCIQNHIFKGKVTYNINNIGITQRQDIMTCNLKMKHINNI